MEKDKGARRSKRVPKAIRMKHPSAYLDWYVNVPHVKYDFRSSGLLYFMYKLDLGEVDLSVNYVHGNPETTKALAKRYNVKEENVFISSEGASGQNARVIRYLAEKTKKKEAIVEYPTYEPLLRQVQEHFPHVKRLERNEKDDFRLDADQLRKIVSKKTALLVLTNPHAPSGAISDRKELEEIMKVAGEFGFFVVCDEIYAEFDRSKVPTVFSVDPTYGIVTTGFSKAYGLGGLKLGTALANKELVDELYADVLNTVGNSPNVVQAVAAELLTKGREQLEKHRQKWVKTKKETERWLKENHIEYFPNKVSVTYWVKTRIGNTHKWINERAIPRFSVAPVPGAFFLFKSGYGLAESNMIRLGIGNVNPDDSSLDEGLEALGKAMETY
jgi:aspartate/methionine/tyrosine aminotransferase